MNFGMEIDKKTPKIAKKFGYTPIKGLDKNRPYVLLAKKDNKYYVIKTSHLEDEAEILKILGSDNFFTNKHIIIPKIYQHDKAYIVEDYIGGREIDIKDYDFDNLIKIVVERLLSIETSFNRFSNIKKFTKGWNDQYSQKGFKNSEWLRRRINRWFSDDMSNKVYRFTEKETGEINNLFGKIKGKNIVTFGAFSPAHIRISRHKLGIFDFGRHIRWAPKHYDRAYLWWGLLYDRDLKESSPKFWENLAIRLSLNIPKNEQAYYWACIIERLAGLAKDLTQSNRAKNLHWKKAIIKIKEEMTIFAINELIAKI